MYFNQENNFFHGIMFHHFHDDGMHKKGQGSINSDELRKLSKFIGRENILNSDEFFQRFKENKLKSTDVCLTFDDSLRCQYDIALPVLDDLNIKCFIFTYTSLLVDEGNLLINRQGDIFEYSRYFRMNYFKSVDDFYSHFFKKVKKDFNNFLSTNENQIKSFKIKYPHYSTTDIHFRLVRDQLLNSEEYRNIMIDMFLEKKFEPKNISKELFLNKNHLRNLKSNGHLIGLHSHSHPTLLEKLSYDDQLKEYEDNINTLSKLLGIKKTEVKFMSHPSGSYNKDSLKILTDLGIELGFKQIMTVEPERGMKKINNSFLEIARQDHADIMKMMK